MHKVLLHIQIDIDSKFKNKNKIIIVVLFIQLFESFLYVVHAFA
jgi:hypothetical protein